MANIFDDIPTEEVADIDLMTRELSRAVSTMNPGHLCGVWLFGSWVRADKPFTKGDVDVFVGFEDDSDPHLDYARTTVSVYTQSNSIYDDRILDVQYGDPSKFLTEIPDSDRVELTLSAFK